MEAKNLRERNTQLLLSIVWEAREISRVDLARRSGLARSTVSVIVQELLRRDLVRTSHLAKSRGGRPPIVLRFNDDRYRILGVDLGASHATVCSVNLRGRVLAEETRAFDVQGDPDGALDLVVDLVERVTAATPEPQDLIGVGLGVPSPLDSAHPENLSERILPQWRGRRPRVELEARLGTPVFMDNDANLGALAEHQWARGASVPSLAYIKVSTGVGSGLILDGRVFSGATGIAGEIGHTAIDASGPPCRCGLSGCLEAMVGAGSLTRRLSELTGEDASNLGPEDIARAAREGDPRCTQVVQEAGRYLGIAIANLVNLVNPAEVVLGGSLTDAGDLLLDPLHEAVRERALFASVEQAQVRVGTLGHRAVALGAATQVLQSFLADPSAVGSPPSSTGRVDVSSAAAIA